MTDMSDVIAIEGELTIYRASELKPLLLAALPGTGPIELDLGEVTEVDTAGVQLLMLLRREALAQGRALRLRRPSPAVAEAFELLDLAGWFGEDEAAQAVPARVEA
ncbi:MAG TPA: STAS domain-containing protein [Aquabacterium sp.]|nr:STAS domain-containing protein [Aquabacterium sp.]